MSWLRGAMLALVGATCATGLLADDPPPANGKLSDKKPGSVNSLENLKLPPGAVIVVCDDTKDALRLLPKAVVLSPEKYQELLDQIEQGKRQAKTEKPEAPSVCRLSGQVEGEFVRLRVRYECHTERPRALIALGTARAWATSATLDDGKLPVLLPLDDGLAIQIETPGTHQIVLELLAPLTVRGTRGVERGIDLGLPRAAITTLENLLLPIDAGDIRLGSRTVRASREPGGQPKLVSVPLGPVEKLDIAWKNSTPEAQLGSPLLSARGKVVARLTEVQLTTDIELSLEVVRGETAQWSIFLPLPAAAVLDVVKPAAQDERISGIQLPTRQSPLLTIRLKEASVEPLQLVLQIRQPRGRTPFTVGPCRVQNTVSQRGTLDVRAGAELRVRCHPHGEVNQREVTEDQRREGTLASFTYASSQAVSGPGAAPVPWLTLESDVVRGAVEGKVAHLLRRGDGESEPADCWRISSKFDVTPLRTGVDRLEVRVPPGWQFDRAAGAVPTDLVEDVALDPQTRTATIRLAQRQFRSFSVALPGSYAAGTGSRKVLGFVDFAADLPTLANWSVERPTVGERKRAPTSDSVAVLDRGGQISVQVPDGMELIAGPTLGERPAPGVREVTVSSERMPARVELLLQALHPDLTVQSQVDISLQDKQARIRQRLQYHFPQIPPIQIEMRVPRSLAGRVRVLGGGQVPPVSEGRGTSESSALHVTLTPDTAAADGASHVVTLEYQIPFEVERPGPMPNGRTEETTSISRRVEIPLVQPEKSARGQAQVRIWCDPGNLVGLAAAGWEAQPLEIVPDHPALPDLVLRGSLDASLTLQVAPRPLAVVSAVVERILVQATLTSNAAQILRTRYVLKRIHARELEVHLPVPVTQAQLDIVLDGKRLTILAPDDPLGRTARVRVEPELYSQPVVLEVACQAREMSLRSLGGVRCTLEPPILDNVLLLGRCRWQVDAPPRWLLAAMRGAEAEQDWGRRGWLLGVRPASTEGELETWLLGTPQALGNSNNEPSLVCWSNAQQAVSVFVVSTQAWLLGCSLVLLAAGLALALLPLPRVLLWACTVGSSCGLILLASLAPGLLLLVCYGCQPGLLVLFLILTAQWLLHHRSRRQIVLLPALKPRKTDSSLARADSSNRRRASLSRDPSTVDEPSRPGSSSPVELREIK